MTSIAEIRKIKTAQERLKLRLEIEASTDKKVDDNLARMLIKMAGEGRFDDFGYLCDYARNPNPAGRPRDVSQMGRVVAGSQTIIPSAEKEPRGRGIKQSWHRPIRAYESSTSSQMRKVIRNTFNVGDPDVVLQGVSPFEGAVLRITKPIDEDGWTLGMIGVKVEEGEKNLRRARVICATCGVCEALKHFSGNVGTDTFDSLDTIMGVFSAACTVDQY